MADRYMYKLSKHYSGVSVVMVIKRHKHNKHILLT